MTQQANPTLTVMGSVAALIIVALLGVFMFAESDRLATGAQQPEHLPPDAHVVDQPASAQRFHSVAAQDGVDDDLATAVRDAYVEAFTAGQEVSPTLAVTDPDTGSQTTVTCTFEDPYARCADSAGNTVYVY